MTSAEQIKSPIKDELKAFESFFANTVKSDVALLNLITKYVLKRKGKQMRPMFVFLTAHLFGKSNEATNHGAALIELMHTATLIHDDVVDNSNQRRGFFSVNALWKNKVAVLLGDFLLSRGLLLAVNNGHYDLLKIVSKAVEEMSEGELLQIEQTKKLKITEAIYFEIIRKKTAVLLAACAAVGAQSVGASPEKVDLMWQLGEDLGMAFQIKDDLFDFEADNQTGKPAGNDLQEKKMTLPLIYALQNADTSIAKSIRKLVSKDKKSKSDIQQVLNFVVQQGGLEYASEKMMEYQNKALSTINSFGDSTYKQAIVALIEYTISRKK
ncbi:MAG: polyprenyl synthetase family protein [Bacteroidales bacterium]|nr:polyprenyl synthetase family protein [Bacteroidales bacterium]